MNSRKGPRSLQTSGMVICVCDGCEYLRRSHHKTSQFLCRLSEGRTFDSPLPTRILTPLWCHLIPQPHWVLEPQKEAQG